MPLIMEKVLSNVSLADVLHSLLPIPVQIPSLVHTKPPVNTDFPVTTTPLVDTLSPVNTKPPVKPYEILEKVLGMSVSGPTLGMLVLLGQRTREEVHAAFSPITGTKQSPSLEFDDGLRAISSFVRDVINETKLILKRFPELSTQKERMKRLGIEMRAKYSNGS
jgi:hypothetical protein